MATSNELVVIGTPITWTDSGSGGTYAMTLAGLANGAARVGPRADLGAFPKAYLYRWHMATMWQATPGVNRTLDLYFVGWDDDATPAKAWQGIGATDAAGVAADRFNLLPAGAVAAVSATANLLMSSGGLIELPYRYVSPYVFNDGQATTHATGGNTIITLTPVIRQGQ